LAVEAAKQYFGSRGLYVVALISGLTDMDAITLSLARMVEEGGLAATTGWRLILIASVANLLFKGLAAGFLGGWKFGVRLGMFFLIAAAGAFAIVWFWPEAWTLQREPGQAG
jgi:uncharacterized membrane protein (DUF4010 family)